MLLGPFARFVGRLPVGRKLLLIYLLDLTAVIYISGILINEKYIAIDFARKELAGNAYIGQVRETLLALPLPLAAAGDDPKVDPAEVQRWIARTAAAEAAHGQGMKSADSSEALARALRELGAHPRIDGARFTAVLDASRALITRIGNQSNMILDPDLDSYYTMSLLLLRYPELDELLARTAQQAVGAGRARGAERERLATHLLILEGRLDAAVKGMESDYGEAVAAGGPTLQAALAASHDALNASLQAFRGQADRINSLQEGSGGFRLDSHGDMPNAVDAQRHDVVLQHTRAVTSLREAWQAAGSSLDVLVQARIDQLIARMWLHFGTAAALLLVLLCLVYFVARQISRPIRQLGRVADQVSRSGDYSVRAAHDSPDEIGQLVTAFNSMLGELDRNRALREDTAATQRAEEAQRALVTAFPTPLLVTSIPDHRILHANDPALPWLEGVATDPWAACLEPQVRARFFQRLADLGSVDSFEVRWQTGSVEGGEAKTQWALLSGRQLLFQGQRALLTAFAPISQIKLLEQRLQLWGKVFEASSESIVIFDAERRFLTANQAFRRATGWDLAEVVGQTPAFLLPDHQDPVAHEAVWHTVALRGSWQGEISLRRKNGHIYPAWVVANAVRGPDGRISHLVAASVDITDRKANEARIRHLAHHDVLTDLPNRSLCMEHLRTAVDQAGRSGKLVGVVFIDLDRFKTINDSMGHHVGDALLRSVGRRLLQAVRAGDTVSRLGGDEFVVVLTHQDSLEQIREVVSGRMIGLVRQPHAVEGLELNVACSAGIAVFPQDGRDVDHLMRHADAAMYQAKAAGRNQAVFFSPEFHAQAQERHLIENALRQVVARDELRLHFQPRIEARSGHVLGVEALLRWQHPEQGLVSPGRFIPIAEETGHILPIGAWVIDAACRQHAAWRREGLGAIPISVNVSALQLRDLALPRLLDAAMREHGVVPAMIELELTETSLMDNAVGTVDTLKDLKALGVTLAIDDFGTGYSSLNYLHQFPIDKLKIDQSFVRDMLDDPADRAITLAIIGLGHTLGLRVVAEGVERGEEEALLRDFGCDELQGYLFGRPMPAPELQRWMSGRVLASSMPPSLPGDVVREPSLENA